MKIERVERTTPRRGRGRGVRPESKRYGLTHVTPSETLRAAGWRQVWEHPSGLLAMRHPSTGRWVVSDGSTIPTDGWCSSLRAAARRIERLAGAVGA